MNEPILITAVGGDLGQALVKALRLESRYAIHGCDVDSTGIGTAFVESFHGMPAASHPEYVDAITDLATRLGAVAMIPASEPEIRVFSRLAPGLLRARGAAVVCQPGWWVDVHGDKLASMEALAGYVELAGFADGSDRAAVDGLVSRVGFPLVVKARRSSGSRYRSIVNHADELHQAIAATPMPVVQEFLDDAHGEYSVGVFVCAEYRTAIAFNRDLGPVGCSWYAENSDDADVLRYALEVAAASRLEGSANVQVRKTSRGVRLLEINPRFSSLVAVRALCGFRDAAWAIDVALGRTPPDPPASYRSVRFRRFFHEVVDLGDGYGAVPDWMPSSVRKEGAGR